MTEISRRKFIELTVVSASAGAAALTDGCVNQRIYSQEFAGRYGGESNKALPYVNQPDGLMDGVPQYFATACGMCPAGCGLFVRTIGGRAVKIEGNPAHPVSAGKTCARGQAALQHLYNPDRLRFPAGRGARSAQWERIDWEPALARVADHAAAPGSAILVDADTFGRSPSAMRVIDEFAARFGSTVFPFGLIDDAPWRAAARAVYDRDQIPSYRLDEADCIVAFNANFLEAWPSPVLYNRLFGEFRQGQRRKKGEHGRFYFIGPRMSMTAAKADRWLPCNPGTEGVVAAALAGALPLENAAALCGIAQADLASVAASIQAAGPRALAVAGDGLVAQPDATRAITAVESINSAVRSMCVGFGSPALAGGRRGAPRTSYLAGLSALAGSIRSGAVRSLLTIGAVNPVFTLPRAFGFAEVLANVPFLASIAVFEDETTRMADVALPARSFLESWGDDVPLVIPPGQRAATLRQPIIDPQFVRTHDSRNSIAPDPWMDTRETADILIDLARRAGRPLTAGTDARDTVRRVWAGIGLADLSAVALDNDAAWTSALSLGGVWSGAASPNSGGGPPTPNSKGAGGEKPRSVAGRNISQTPTRLGEGALLPAASVAGADEFTLALYPHLYWTDGRHSNLGWLQEIPDPMTSAVWNTWIEINLQTAERMGIRTGDVLRLTTPHGYLEAPAFPSPGIHPAVVAMPIGNGHAPGRYGRNPRGENPLVILDPAQDAATGALAFAATTVRLRKVRDALAGYHPEAKTLVLVQDRPGGQEPEAVQDLIHTTAKEWAKAPPVKALGAETGSIFHRG